MDPLHEATALSEINFDELLDATPVKKNGESLTDGDPLELHEDIKTKTDNSVNALGSKKLPLQKTIVAESASATHREGVASVSQSGPVVLNSRNILPKMSIPLVNNFIKVTPKNTVLISTNHTNTSNSVIATAANMGQVKTAYKASGQKIFIQKASTGTAGTLTGVKLQSPGSSNPMVLKTITSPVTSAAKTVGNINKTVLQMIRTPNGKFVHVRPTIGGKNSTMTLSPATLAGKRIISAQGKVLIKTPVKALTALPSAETVTTTPSSTNVLPVSRTLLKNSAGENIASNSKTIVVQSPSGKQIIVSNQNLIKFSPKSQSITTTAGSVSTTSANSSPKVGGHAIQIPGQTGVQYIRVVSDTKLAPKSAQSTTTASTTTTNTIFAAATAVNSKVNTSSSVGPIQKAKILNSVPQHFKVQRAAYNKLVVTQPIVKTNTTTSTFSPVASKVEKTIVTMPALRPISSDKIKTLTLIRNGSSTVQTQAALAGKHKISESTESELADNSSGAPENKKPALSKRLILIPNSMQRALNNGVQIQGRVNAQMVLVSKDTTKSSTTTPVVSSGVNISATNNTKNLYSVLKPQTTQSQQLYSVLKSNNTDNTTATTTALSATPISKPIIFNAQQQQKLQELRKPATPSHSSGNSPTITPSDSTFLAVKIKEEPLDSAVAKSKFNIKPLPANCTPPLLEDTKGKEEVLVGGIRRKHCNCSKSQCLKLYCDCFANGEFCQNCTCKDCYNNLEYEDERQHAIKNCLGRNPSAFKPKIIAGRDQGDMRLHNKGCNCKRSGCLKNYCECYEAKIPCSSNCKCYGCRNVEDRPDLDMDPIDPKIMVTIANATNQMSSNDSMPMQKRTYERANLNNVVSVKTEKVLKENMKTNSNGAELLAASNNTSPSLEKQQCNFITQEVIDATIQCMITQADECEKNGLPPFQTEKMVMEELGRCLVEIIDFSIRNTDNAFAQD